MEQGRESPTPIPDDGQTTGRVREERLSTSDSSCSADSQLESSDVSGDRDGSVDTASSQEGVLETVESQYSEFREQIEVFFSRAEDAILRNRFHNLETAKTWMLSVRDVGQRYTTKGCKEAELEHIVVNRALTTVDKLMDGVQTNHEEIYDPRQTTAYVYCAMAVFPCTLGLGRSETGVRYHLSNSGSSALPLLDELSRYCAIKATFEEMEGWWNTVRFKRLLLNLAEWLEVDRAPVTFLITNKSLPVIGALINRFVRVHDLRNQFQELMVVGVVLAASSLIRENLLREAREYHRILMKMDTSSLPPALETRRLCVYARLLQNCGEFAKALDHANEALRGVSDSAERREIRDLIMELTEMQENAVYTRNIKGPADVEWLEGTNALQNEVRRDSYESIRQRHHSRTDARRQKTKTVPVGRRGETPSRSPANQCRQRGVSPRNPLDRLSGIAPFYSSSPTSSDHSHTQDSSARFPSIDSLLDSNESEESDDEEDERPIQFVDSPDEDDEEDEDWAEQDMSSDDRTRLVAVEKMDEEGDERDWFEKSEEFTASRDVDEEDVIHLSESQESYLNKEGPGRGFYHDFYDNPRQLLKDDPKRYKRCQLKIERCHRATAKVLDSKSKYSEIVIDGRSKAGRTYMDDEVVVEIMAEPGELSGLQLSRGASSSSSAAESVEKMAHGKVVGLLNRVRFAHEAHPVLFCTLDEKESHLMKPLCKTVPKIHVMNDKVRKNYPTLVKHRIEIKTISPDGEVQFKGYCNVQPDKREQYVFKVVILAWRQGNIYPLGAVLEAHIGGKDYAGGLQVLSMQQRVPKLYPRAAVEDTKRIIEESFVPKTGRLDLRGQRLFTVDPPGSRDLDDAISVKTEGAHVVVGVHIADVAAVVKKDSGVDQEARRRAFTFYPLQRQPHCMLPEPLSHGQCSLLPGKPRLAFSLFFKFNQKGTQVGEPEISRTLIQSQQQLTYEQVQRVIDGHPEGNVDPLIQKDILKVHAITTKLREKRQKDSLLFVPFEDPRLSDLEHINECMASHSLIEELMILTNHHIASFLTKQPRYVGCMIVRCHKAPTWEELQQWQREEGSITDLVMQLQGKPVTPSTHLSFNNKLEFRGQVVVQRQVWEKLCRHLEEGQVEKAGRLAFMDGLHPLQSLAAGSWLDLMQTAEYTSAQDNDLRHFGLDLSVYTHFTSPIRRYTDLHIQRILHAALDGRSPDCNSGEVMELCQHINSAHTRQKAFSKGCMALKVADSLQRQPLVFRAYVDTVDDEQLTLSLPSLCSLPDRRQELPFSMLGVSCQPELVTDTLLQRVSVTVQWNSRLYDEAGKCPGPLLSVWQHLEKPKNKPQSESNAPTVLTIRPDLLSETVRQEDWVKILKFLASGKERCWNNVPQPILREKFEVEYMSSEKGDGKVSEMPVKFKRVYSRGQIVQIQMSAEPKRGMLKPRVEILHTARNACVCTQHVSEPVLTLSRSATRSARDQQFSRYKEYVKAWMPLLEMEAAVSAGDSNGSIVIDNIPVTIKTQTSSRGVLYRGSFTLPATYCYDRCIEFGGKSVDSIQKEEYKSDNSFPLDYLCLRYKAQCSAAVVSRVVKSQVSDSVDKHYTWLAHASVVQVLHKNSKVVVIFALSPSSPPPLPQLMADGGARITLEILPKTEVDRRSQEMLLQLENPKCELAQAIAFGRSIPKLDPDHKRLGKKDAHHEVNIEEGAASRPPPTNNKAQLASIKLAMTNSLAIIQGPPGTGKTNTDIKLVYLFCKINRQLQADGKGRKTVLYCGPSNKSVDLVARELKKKLGTQCPKIVRMYGSTIESKDYPVPVGDVRSTRGMRDLKSDPNLQDIALHHLIREQGKPSAEDIAVFEKHFDKCRKDPKLYSVTNKQLKKYRKLLFKASVEELRHYEVVLCTCAVGGNRKLIEGTEGSVYQVIIDECAMSPEPQSMVPIVATQAKQVVLIGDHKQLRPIIKCQPAAELGLDQSLFERLFNKFPAFSTFLNTQYRMDPEICAFPAKEFYDKKLKTGYSSLWCGGWILKFWPKYPPGTDRNVPHLLIDVRGEEETLTVSTDEGNERSKSNQKEADKVIEILTFLRKNKVDILNVKLLTQYNAQRHLLETKLKTVIGQNVEHVFDHYDRGKINVSTVVSSQGGEWDYVILSTVRSLPSYKIEPHPTHGWCRQNMGFITDCNQVNVALTRARKGLFIVGNMELLKCDGVWNNLFHRYANRGCYVENPDDFPPKNARRWTKKKRQPNATSDWQAAASRRAPLPEEGQQ